MCYESERLISKIKYLEDKMLRSKNFQEQLRLQGELMLYRIKLQKLKLEESKRSYY